MFNKFSIRPLKRYDNVRSIDVNIFLPVSPDRPQINLIPVVRLNFLLDIRNAHARF
jgi:hypothetical protein